MILSQVSSPPLGRPSQLALTFATKLEGCTPLLKDTKNLNHVGYIWLHLMLNMLSSVVS
jgi:hypothetical protein